MTDTEILDRIERMRFVPVPMFDRIPTTDKEWNGWKVEFVGWAMSGDEKTYPTLREAVVRWSEKHP